ncbi:MAG: hypothetical protein LBQ10_12125 [Desulfovibrio sp.]|jgi:SOS-response transcriptional repressor LexA|nr:hypothetical protein [Desulfovibrio sp.]
MRFERYIRDFLKENSAKRGWGTRFAEDAGITQSSMNKIISGETKDPQLSTISKIIDAMEDGGYTLPSIIKRTGAYSPPETVTGDDLIMMPVYRWAGAGPGIELADTQPLFTIPIPPKYFFQADFAVVVDGHSMEPTIQNQSIVGANSKFNNFAPNELYVVCRPHEGYMVKRVALSEDKETVFLRSDNENKNSYPDTAIPYEEAKDIIKGRVVWILYGY